MTLSIEEEAGMEWMAGCVLVLLSIAFVLVGFAGLKYILLLAICGIIMGFYYIFKSIKQIKLFTKRD